MNLRGLRRLQSLRKTLHTYAKHILKRQQNALHGVEKAQSDLHDEVLDEKHNVSGVTLQELDRLGMILRQQSREVEKHVLAAQQAAHARAQESAQIDKVVEHLEAEVKERLAQQEHIQLEDWLRHGRGLP